MEGRAGTATGRSPRVGRSGPPGAACVGRGTSGLHSSPRSQAPGAREQSAAGQRPGAASARPPHACCARSTSGSQPPSEGRVPGTTAPTRATRARTETRQSPVDEASETDAGPASSFWGFYFFKIIHTNGYSHKHDLTKILLAYHISRTAPAQVGQRPHTHDRRRRPDRSLAPASRCARPPSLGTRGSCQNRERQPWFCFSKLF